MAQACAPAKRCGPFAVCPVLIAAKSFFWGSRKMATRTDHWWEIPVEMVDRIRLDIIGIWNVTSSRKGLVKNYGNPIWNHLDMEPCEKIGLLHSHWIGLKLFSTILMCYILNGWVKTGTFSPEAPPISWSKPCRWLDGHGKSGELDDWLEVYFT